MSHSLKDYQKLHLKKYRDQWGLFAVEGKHICQEALLSGWEIETAFISEDFQREPDYETILERMTQKNCKPHILSPQQFKKLSDTESPQGIILIMVQPSTALNINLAFPRQKILVILDGIRDPGNLGTIIRSADWFGIQTIIVSPDTVDIFNSKVVRASMGSLFRVKCFESPDITETIKELKSNKIALIGASPYAACDLEEHQPVFPSAIILGGEAAGISSELYPLLDTQIRISKSGQAESLNVAVAAGILMNYYTRIAAKLN